MSEHGLRRNFFIFLTKDENLKVCMKHCLYGADVSQSDQRSLGNVKPGDLALVWVPETKLLYGVFEIMSRVFYQETDIAWTKNWPYRCGLKLWDTWLRVIRGESKAKLMSFVSRELTTLTDLTNLGGFIHTLLYDEGSKLFRFFIANSELEAPTDVFPDFGTAELHQLPQPMDFGHQLSRGSLAEYNIEMYLLQHAGKLEELVGSGITELYNMLFGYQGRYLDIMTVHRDENGNLLKATIIELKAKALDESGLVRALDELASYMFWARDQMEKGKITGDPDSTHGILLSPFEAESKLRDRFKELRKDYATQYGIDAKKIRWIGYESHGAELFFKPIY